jgi:hypothetical protein
MVLALLAERVNKENENTIEGTYQKVRVTAVFQRGIHFDGNVW